MKKMSFLVSGMFLALAILPAIPGRAEGGQATNSAWASQPPKVDGAAREWEASVLAEWEKGGVQYAFRNDAQNLYVLFIVKDAKFRSTIEDVGITLYFSTEGKEKKDYGILFRRKRITAEESIALLEKEGPVSEDQKAQIRSRAFYNYYAHEVLTKKAEGPLPQEGISVPPAFFKYAAQQKTLVYEFAIPLARVQEMAAGVGAEPGAKVMVGFEWGGPTEEQRKAIARARGERANITNETDVSGMNRMDPTGGARGIDRLPPKYSFWSTVQLAKAGE